MRARKVTRDQILKRVGFKAAAGYVGSLKKNVKSRYSLDMYNIVKDDAGNSIYVSYFFPAHCFGRRPKPVHFVFWAVAQKTK